MARPERRTAGGRALWFALGAVAGVAVTGAAWLASGTGRAPTSGQPSPDAPPGTTVRDESVADAAAPAEAVAEPEPELEEEKAMADRDAPKRPAYAEGMRLRDRWLRERLTECRLGAAGERAPAHATKRGPGLEVLANNDPVLQNRIGERPIKLGGKEYSRGLYCHAISKVVVRLPGPGKAFSAVIGLDDNPDTSRGRGSVVFKVSAGGRALFESDVMRYETPPRDISVDLGGAEEFVLEVGDAGDGIGWDQSDWADAKVTLASGEEVWLGDMPLADNRTPGAVVARTSDLAFAFLVGGESSDAFLARAKRNVTVEKVDAARTRRTITWTDAATGIEVRLVAVEYADFPAVEWTVYLKNTGEGASPLIEGIQGLDASIERAEGGEFVLRHWRGDTCAANLYEPLERTLRPGDSARFAPGGGRGTNGEWPYYNLVTPGGGVLLAVGWPGQWATTFARDGGRALRVTAGQELTRLKLEPGEEVRTPLIAMLFWEGADLEDAQNLWRRWMWAHNVPRDSKGELFGPRLFGCTSGIYNEMLGANEENQKFFIDRFLEENIKLDFWWMDAGWYPCGGQWWNVGTWEPDPERFPKGLRAIADHAHARGMRILVWFEPERVKEGWLKGIRPEWVLGGQLLDLGNPDARQWLTDHVDRTITEQGIDLYRQDFNMDPLGCWRGKDSADRQGMAENLHVQGYLAYWDALRERHPDVLIDSCASGGRRNDLETMRRAVPLHPTDYNYSDLPAKQAYHQSLLQWIPYFGSNNARGGGVGESYASRSGYGMGFTIGPDMRRRDQDLSELRRATDQWRRIVARWRGDYYPLTPYSVREEDWCAWQFVRPEEGTGVVQAFRRAACAEESMTFRLRGLDPRATYDAVDLDVGEARRLSGAELMEKGLEVRVPGRPGAAVVMLDRAR